MRDNQLADGFWDDGDWIAWDDFGDWEQGREFDSQLERLEYEADLRHRYPLADIALVPYFHALLSLAEGYYRQTGRHLNAYGDIGELYGSIRYGISLHRNFAQGSDGRLGNDFVEIKTLSPARTGDMLEVSLKGHFNKLLVVRISAEFEVTARLFDRRELLALGKGPLLRLSVKGVQFQI